MLEKKCEEKKSAISRPRGHHVIQSGTCFSLVFLIIFVIGPNNPFAGRMGYLRRSHNIDNRGSELLRGPGGRPILYFHINKHLVSGKHFFPADGHGAEPTFFLCAWMNN